MKYKNMVEFIRFVVELLDDENTSREKREFIRGVLYGFLVGEFDTEVMVEKLSDRIGFGFFSGDPNAVFEEAKMCDQMYVRYELLKMLKV